MYEKQGCNLDLAEEVKKYIAIPVGSVGRIKDVRMADATLKEGKVDFVCMGRPLIADPEIVGKPAQDNLQISVLVWRIAGAALTKD